jgi:hypothetical protein
MNEKLPKHVSYSSYNTWLECGWKYKLTKLDEVPEKHAVWFTGGSAVHKATELWDKQTPGDIPNSEVLWNSVWFDQVAEDEKLNGDMNTWQFAKREDMSWWYGEGIWMLDRWIKFRKGGWNIYENFIEKEYEIPVGDTTVRLAIDRVMTDFDGNRVLVDIKTGASSQRHPLQLAVYAWALQTQGISVDKAGFWDARTGIISSWNIEHLNPNRIEEMFTTFDKARKADIFLPNFNNCGRCGVLSYCKWMNGRHTLELDKKQTDEGKTNG